MKKFRVRKYSWFKKVLTPFSTETKAQSGAVFRLMIDGIIGMAILLIILSAMSYFNALRISASNEKFYSLVSSATNSPTGKVFEEKGLIFNPGGFSGVSIRNKTNIYEGCFEFQSNLVSTKINTDKTQIEFTNPIEANIYVQCSSLGQSCAYDAEKCCEMKCIISFGKKIIVEES